MRKHIYNDIVNTLKRGVYDDNGNMEIYTPEELAAAQQEEANVGKKVNYIFKHFDLWNHNVEFIEQENIWATPAIFIQFDDIQYSSLNNGVQEATIRFHLHIVSDTTFRYGGQDQVNSMLDLLEVPYKILQYYRGNSFSGLTRIGSMTNNDHEQLIENVETFSCRSMAYKLE